MATSQLTLQDIQDQIHTAYTNASDTPAFGTDDWNIRVRHISRAVNFWAAQKAVEWNELWTTGATLPTTITNATTSYALPADFNYMGGYARINTANGVATIPIIQAEEAQQYTNQSRYLAYITGKPGSYFLKLLWTPATGDAYTGSTLTFDYYKYPLILSATTDIPEMSDPFFIVEFVTAKLFQTQSPTNYTIHNNLATDLLTQMMEANQLSAFYNNSPDGINVIVGA